MDADVTHNGKRLEDLMAQITIGIREFKRHFGMYMERVRSGTTIVITDHGKPIGQLIPAENQLDAKVQALIQSGVLAWNGRKLAPHIPLARSKGTKSVADLLIEDRE